MGHRQTGKTHALQDFLLHLSQCPLGVAFLQQNLANAFVSGQIIRAQAK